MSPSTTYPTAVAVDPDELDRHITEMYRHVANGDVDDLHFPTGRRVAEVLGYPLWLLDRLPAEAVSSFAGVGYHLPLAQLRRGDRVLDLGSGAGMDVFAAAVEVGTTGSVTGVDMTPEQLARAERQIRDQPVSFVRARIEELPFDDGSFDVVISNGVINLSAAKRRVFAEAARVLRPGGRLSLADIVTERQIVERTACQADLWAACIAGASRWDLYLDDLASAGFRLEFVRANPTYTFTSERAKRAGAKYGAQSLSLLAYKPVLINTTTTTRGGLK
jgi:SAM-dependent methyltransferase